MSAQPDLPPEAAQAHPLERADVKATAHLAEHRKDPAVKALGKLSEVGDQPPLFVLGGALLLFGLVGRSRREVEAGLRVLAAEALATAVKSAVKDRVARTRPSKMLDDGEYRAEADAPHGKHEQSFPSGHTAGAVAVAAVLTPVYPRAAAPMLGCAAVIAAIQPARGAHYLTDVAAGAVIGALSAAVVDGGFRLANAALSSR